MGNGWFPLTYGIAGPIGNNDSATAYVLGQTVHLVAKITVVDGAGADTIELYIDQVTEGSADATVSGAFDDITRITSRAGNGSTATTIENLVVATDYADVAAVPEPSSTALLGLGAISLLLRRRK